jgi:hypothetical protein
VGPIKRKGSKNVAKSGATAVDQPNVGRPPNFKKPTKDHQS